jgi:hypothetical protein
VPTFVHVARHGDRDDVVERLDVTVDRSTVRLVDERIHRGGEQIARGDHVGVSEVHQDVAVGVRGRLDGTSGPPRR